MITAVAGFLLLQLWPYGRHHTNPPIVQEPAWNSPQTRALVKRACFDCHSNETVWPWYSYISPMSMVLQRDVEEGRAVLNFSEWQGTDIERLVEVVSKDQMPLPYYLILHPEARFTDAEKGQLINGLLATVGEE